jgi:hypothetical protein
MQKDGIQQNMFNNVVGKIDINNMTGRFHLSRAGIREETSQEIIRQIQTPHLG